MLTPYEPNIPIMEPLRKCVLENVEHRVRINLNRMIMLSLESLLWIELTDITHLSASDCIYVD